MAQQLLSGCSLLHTLHGEHPVNTTVSLPPLPEVFTLALK